MDVYPPGSANPTSFAGRPTAGEELVDATYDYTAHVPGIDLACPYFPGIVSNGQTCPSSIPGGEVISHLTADVVSITDPPNVKGALAGAGGTQAVIGVMIVPDAPEFPNGVSIAEESCSLKDHRLCQVILDDFLVRQVPVPVYQPG